VIKIFGQRWLDNREPISIDQLKGGLSQLNLKSFFLQKCYWAEVRPMLIAFHQFLP
jgi:hypothetical protein